ncbi:MAG: hypothetical protein GEU75_03990 [Dehalococcoidia bacterium]|nr:hypothetical protein [Dehalococcoidia bacterium]
MDNERDGGATNRNARTGLLAAAGEKVSGYGRQVGEQALERLDARREKVAETIEHAAKEMRETAATRDGVGRYFRERTAAGVASTGFFLHEHSVGELSSIGQGVRQHQLLAIIIALFVGYLIGRAFSRQSDHITRSDDALES